MVKLPMDRGEGQRWNAAPGNLYSAPRKIRVDPGRGGTVRIVLDQEIPPIAAARTRNTSSTRGSRASC